MDMAKTFCCILGNFRLGRMVLVLRYKSCHASRCCFELHSDHAAPYCRKIRTSAECVKRVELEGGIIIQSDGVACTMQLGGRKARGY